MSLDDISDTNIHLHQVSLPTYVMAKGFLATFVFVQQSIMEMLNPQTDSVHFSLKCSIVIVIVFMRSSLPCTVYSKLAIPIYSAF